MVPTLTCCAAMLANFAFTDIIEQYYSSRASHFHHTYSKPQFNPNFYQNFLFPSHLEELATFQTH